MERKRRFIHVCIGILLGIMITVSSTGILAATGMVTIDVYFDQINISVNGQKVDQKNILYQGTTYAPLRAIAEMLGYEVTWIPETSTADIRLPGEVSISQSWKLVDKTFLDVKEVTNSYYDSDISKVDEHEWQYYVSTDELNFVVDHTWSELPEIIKPNEKVTITLTTDLVEYYDEDNKYNLSSELWAYWGDKMVRPYDKYDIADNKYYLSEEYSTNYSYDRDSTNVVVVDGNLVENNTPVEVYFISPEAGYSDELYVVIKHYGSFGLTYYQYTYEWQE